MKILALLPEEGYSISYKFIDEYEDISTLNTTGGASTVIKNAMKQSSALDVEMIQYYDFTETLYASLTLDVELYFKVIDNYNGYTVMIVGEPSESLLTIDEFREWNKTHVATWVDNTWVYTKR